MSREVIIIHAIRTYHAKNQGLLFDLSMVKTDDYWAAMDFLGKYSFLIEKVQLEALPRETEEPKLNPRRGERGWICGSTDDAR